MKNIVSHISLYTPDGVSLKTTLHHKKMKVCWCKAFGEDRCTGSEDFKKEVGEVFYSGFGDMENIKCSLNTYCSVDVEYYSFYDIVKGLSSFLLGGVKLYVRKNCNDEHGSLRRYLTIGNVSQATVMSESNGIIIMKNNLKMTGVVRHLKPRRYALCITDEDDSISTRVGYITMSGLYELDMKMGVYLGKPFDITIRGLSIEDLTGFISSDKSCTVKINDGPLTYLISEDPDIQYDDDQINVLMWHNVTILRKNKTLYFEGRGNKDTMNDVLYVCLTTKGHSFFSGLTLIVHLPQMARMLSHVYGGSGNLRMLPLALYEKYGHGSFLIVTVLWEHSIAETCEFNSWETEHSRVILTWITINDKKDLMRFPALNNSTNTYVCWCYGNSCKTIGDFNVSLSIPRESGTNKFQIIPYGDASIKVFYSGQDYSVADRINVVDRFVLCGSSNAVRPSVNTLPVSTVTTNSIKRKKGVDSVWASKIYWDVIYSGVVSRNFKELGWTSQTLRFRMHNESSHMIFRLCYCPFFNHYSCRKGEDFTEWVGAIVKQANKESEALVRIITYPSHMEEGVLPCRPNNNVHASVSLVFRITDELNKIKELITDFVAINRESHEGFLVEVCHQTVKNDTSSIVNYRHILSTVHNGYFRMQNLYVTVGSSQDVVLYGMSMPPHFIKAIVVMTTDYHCSLVDRATIIASSTKKTIINPNIVVFHDILIETEGEYQFCIHLAEGKDYALEITNSFYESVNNRLHSEYIGNSNIIETGYIGNRYADAAETTHAEPSSHPIMTSLLELTSANHFKVGGTISAIGYQLRYVSDFMAFSNINTEDSKINSLTNSKESSCKTEGYKGFMLLCALVDSKRFIVTDCNHDIWVVTIPGNNEFLSKLRTPHRLNIMSDKWKMCKEYISHKKIVFLGDTFVLIISSPLKDKVVLVSAFRHDLRKPMDIVALKDVVMVSDEVSRRLFVYHCPSGYAEKAQRSYALIDNCYFNALHVMENKDNIHDMFTISAKENILTHYRIVSGLHFTADLVVRYSGAQPVEGVDIGALHNPSCIDGFIQKSIHGPVKVLIVGENVTGRVLVFKSDQNKLGVYKEISTSHPITNIFVNPTSGLLIFSAWQIYQGQMANYVLIKSLDSYIELDFSYDIQDNYHIGAEVEWIPTLKGDQFEFFKEYGNGLKTSVSLMDIGLSINGNTGVISGKLAVTGRFEIVIMGGNMLKTITRTFSLRTLCPPSQQFNFTTKSCEQCPIGTYRNEESQDTCRPCTDERPNSTTLVSGARFLDDCVCEGGYYMKDYKCVLCEMGTFKLEPGNDACVGQCGLNMTSIILVDQGKPVAKCVCMPKYFDLKLAVEKWDTLPPDVTSLLGLTFSEDNPKVPNNIDDIRVFDDVCIPCPVGYFCEGNKEMPKSCGVGRTTIDKLNDTQKACLCDVGYGYTSQNSACIPCSVFGYKYMIGNTSCMQCENPSNRGRRQKRLKVQPLFGSTKIVDENEWNDELRLHYLNSPERYLQITHLLSSMETYATSERATQIDQCSYCVSGMYFDSNSKICVECPSGRFCPGGDASSMSCGQNGITKGEMAAGPLDCFCPKGYGNEYEGFHPTTRKILCQSCPLGYFQHLDHSDGMCLPCPAHSTTNNVGATSLLQCIASAGFYLEIMTGFGDNWSPYTVPEDGNEILEDLLVEASGSFKVDCLKVLSESIKSGKSYGLIRSSMKDCHLACENNIYCKGFSYEDTYRYLEHDHSPYKVNETLRFNGLRFIKQSFGVCTLHFFTLSFTEVSDSKLMATSPDEVQDLCSVTARTMSISFEAKPCPIGYFCNRRVSYQKCPEYSTTLGLGATSMSDCLCMAGYEPSSDQAGVCIACQLGTYKQEIGNHGCKRCPDRFRTFAIGSRYITDCACGPGYYALLPVENKRNIHHTDVYKRMKDTSFQPSSAAEVSEVHKTLLSNLKANRDVNTVNPYSIDVNMYYQDKNQDVVSFIYLSQLTLILPVNAPLPLLEALKDYKQISCQRCKLHYYCPGGWVENNKGRLVHNVPYRCPRGSSVPKESTNAVSVSHCLCLPGYKVDVDDVGNENKRHNAGSNRSVHPHGYINDDSKTVVEDKDASSMIGVTQTMQQNSSEYQKDYERSIAADNSTPQCVKCEAGMYKEGQENAPCSGRCMQYATTFGGAVSKKQCFCTYGRYMKFDGTLGSLQLVCARCMAGAICTGGLHPQVVEKLRNDGSFVDISLSDHVQPKPRFGFFAAFKHQGVEKWDPLSQTISPLSKVPTEMLHFHACPLEYNCVTSDVSNCAKGTTGYLCMGCDDGHDRCHFRSTCSTCHDFLIEVMNYMRGRSVLWLIATIFLVMLRKKQVHLFILFKIWFGFCASMAPYGTIPLNTSSSLRRFAIYYNTIFGFQQLTFKYIRLRCIMNILGVDRFDDTKIWYIQRFVTVFQPMLDGAILFIALASLGLLHKGMKKLRSMVFPRRNISRRTSLSSKSSKTSEEPSYVEKSVDGAQNVIDYGKRKGYLKPWISYRQCTIALYYVSFQFICQELLQMLWCVDVEYMNEGPFKVLLYRPSYHCNFDIPLFYYGFITALTLLTIIFSCFTVLLLVALKRNFASPIFTTGRRMHMMGWDALLFLRSFSVAMNTVFQPSNASTGSGEKLRATFSVMTTALMIILHTLLLPYLVRDDNIYNRLELLSLILNSFTAFMILGSFSYDFNHSSIIPVLAFLLYPMILLWYTLVECGYISDLRPRLRRRGACCKLFWRFCRRLLVWNCSTQMTFNYATTEMVMERPFVDMKRRTDLACRTPKNTSITLAGRRALCTSMEQSLGRYVIEQLCFRVPVFWNEFIIRYTFGYKWENLEERGRRIMKSEIRVKEMFDPCIFDIGTINTWQLSTAVLQATLRNLVRRYIVFEHIKLGELWLLKVKYSELCFKATEALYGRVENVDEMIESVHELNSLKEKRIYLESQLEFHLRNAEDGRRITRQVQELGNGMDELIDDPITNEEILRQIAEYEYNKLREHSLIR